ncbi:MAG: CoA transferase [Acidimicrobiales bacterium]
MTDGSGTGFVVVTWSPSLAAAVAAKLLADNGARVVRVEPPGGSDLSRRPPLTPDGISAWFRYLCRSATVVGPDEIPSWAAAPDIALVDPTHPAPDGGSDSTVVVELTTYGPGPYGSWRASELTTWALGGYLSFTGAPDREPLWLAGGQAAQHTGSQAAFAALAALHARDHADPGAGNQPGSASPVRGQRVVVSELASVLTAHSWLASSWAACGLVLPRVPSDLIRAADGWCYVMRIVPNEELLMMTGQDDLLAEGITEDIVAWNDHIDRIFAGVASWAASRTVAEIVELGQALRVAVTPVLTAADLVDDPQLAARDWWRHDVPTGLRLPGPAYRTVPLEANGPAADGPPAGGSRRPPADRDTFTPLPGATGPLTGLRVVEVTNNWAGPVAARMFADLGADVIKVEWADRPATRALYWAGPFQDREPDGHERSMYFHELNRNKRDVVIDLSDPTGRDVFLDLIATADVFIENMSARVMPNLELDWPVLSQVNPRLVMVSMSGYGATGPHRDWVAYGSNIETTSGLTSVTGYPDGVLSRTTLFYADPVSGQLGAMAALAALRRVAERGTGEWIDLSLNEAGAGFVADAILHHSATGETPGPQANDDARFAPHGVYRCAGTDNWVAIAVQDDDDWRRLCDEAGFDDLAADPALATLAGRWARRRELDERIGAWTAPLGHYPVARRLQAVGVAAAPVLANWQIPADPHIHHSGFFAPIEHPEVGVYPTPTWPWQFAETPATLRRHAPLFAQDNRQILGEIGLSAATIDALYAKGVTADEPTEE